MSGMLTAQAMLPWTYWDGLDDCPMDVDVSSGLYRPQIVARVDASAIDAARRFLDGPEPRRMGVEHHFDRGVTSRPMLVRKVVLDAIDNIVMADTEDLHDRGVVSGMFGAKDGGGRPYAIAMVRSGETTREFAQVLLLGELGMFAEPLKWVDDEGW